MRSLLIIFIKATLFICVLFAAFRLGTGIPIDANFFRTIFAPLVSLIVFLTIAHYWLAKKSGVTDNFNVNQTLVLNEDIDLPLLKREITERTKWKIANETSSCITLTAGMDSLKSFGEKIKVTKSNSKIVINSKPILFTTLFDFGKNFQNTMTIKHIVEQTI